MLKTLQDVLYLGVKVLDGSIGDGVSREQDKKNRARGKELEKQIKKEIKNHYTVLTDVYLPLPNNKGYTEVDLIAISNQGVFVIESKNYKATITGDYSDNKWQAHYGVNRAYPLYSPVAQNSTHIDVLKRLVPHLQGVPVYSIVVFPDVAKLEISGKQKAEVFTRITKLETVLTNMLGYKHSLTAKQVRILTKEIKKYGGSGFFTQMSHRRRINTQYKKN